MLLAAVVWVGGVRVVWLVVKVVVGAAASIDAEEAGTKAGRGTHAQGQTDVRRPAKVLSDTVLIK